MEWLLLLCYRALVSLHLFFPSYIQMAPLLPRLRLNFLLRFLLKIHHWPILSLSFPLNSSFDYNMPDIQILRIMILFIPSLGLTPGRPIGPSGCASYIVLIDCSPVLTPYLIELSRLCLSCCIFPSCCELTYMQPIVRWTFLVHHQLTISHLIDSINSAKKDMKRRHRMPHFFILL